VKPGARIGLAFSGSLALHGALLFWGVLVYAPEFDIEIDVEFTDVELLDPDQIQAQAPPPPEVQPVVPPPPTPNAEPPEEPATDPAEEEKKKKEEEKKKAEAEANKRDLGKRATQVDELGPTNSTFYMLLVPKKIRQLSYGDKALAVMAPLPDYQYLIAGGGLDALKDFDHLVIASSDIRDWTQTFLAVDYTMSREKMKAAIERAVANADETIEWTEEKGTLRGNPTPKDGSEDVDPRWFVLIEDKVAVYVREEFLPHVLADDDAAAEEPTSGSYVANLAKLRKFASRQPTAGMQVVMKDLRAAAKRTKGLPFQLPDRIELSVEATEEPELLVRADWPELVETKAAENWWKNDLPRILDGNLKAKPFKWMVYDVVDARRKQNTLELWARFETDQASMILGIIGDQLSKIMKKTPQELAAQQRERLEAKRKREEKRQSPQAPSSAEGVAPPGDGAQPDIPPKPEPAEDVPKPDPGSRPPQGGGAGF
jgi:hypothetical protein